MFSIFKSSFTFLSLKCRNLVKLKPTLMTFPFLSDWLWSRPGGIQTDIEDTEHQSWQCGRVHATLVREVQTWGHNCWSHARDNWCFISPGEFLHISWTNKQCQSVLTLPSPMKLKHSSTSVHYNSLTFLVTILIPSWINELFAISLVASPRAA